MKRMNGPPKFDGSFGHIIRIEVVESNTGGCENEPVGSKGGSMARPLLLLLLVMAGRTLPADGSRRLFAGPSTPQHNDRHQESFILLRAADNKSTTW